MITSSKPRTWKALQDETARIFREWGFTVETEKEVVTARGKVELDVYAEEVVDGRRYSIICECKHWNTRVPKNVVHGFRTVVSDFGANLGLIVSSNDYQSGAHIASTFTNIKLVTWEGFQAEFEQTWLLRFLQRVVAERCGPLLSYAEPFLPVWFDALTDNEKEKFVDLKKQHDEFGWLMMAFTPYVHTLRSNGFPPLPLRQRVAKLLEQGSVFPNEVIDALGYREFLDLALAHSDDVIAQFRSLRPSGMWPPHHEVRDGKQGT